MKAKINKTWYVVVRDEVRKIVRVTDDHLKAEKSLSVLDDGDVHKYQAKTPLQALREAVGDTSYQVAEGCLAEH